MNTQLAIPPPVDVAMGIEAWRRLKTASVQSWEDWKIVGWVLYDAQEEKKRETNSKSTHGKAYQNKMKEWLEDNGFDDVHKTERSQIVSIVSEKKYKLADIEEWLNKQPGEKRRRINHPVNVLSGYRAYLRKEGKVDNTDEKQKKQTLREANRELQEENDHLHQHVQEKDEELREANEMWDQESEEDAISREKLIDGFMALAKEFVPEDRYEEFKERADKMIDEIFPPEDEDEDEYEEDKAYEPMF